MSTIDQEHLNTLRFRCIGPTRGGRVVAVAGDPEQRGVFFFGGAAGGVWRSDDGGQFWENVTDGQLSSAAIGALAVAPSDPNVVYAGTGETTIRIDVTHGDGVYRSTDSGRNWRHIGLADSRHIGEIRVHPEDPDTVYVAALGHASRDNDERGLYRSTDGGESWDRVLHVSARAGAVDVALDPSNPRIVYATIWQARRTFWSMDSGGPDCGLWRSLDGGDTWEDITRRSGLPDGTIGKIGVAVAPARSGRVWAIVEAEMRKRGLYRSDDNGETWKKVSSKPDLTWRPWYYMHVVAHPTDPDTVYVLNQKAWISTDAGETWTEFHTPHGDNHALWIDPNDPDRMIGADDGGAWVSVNAGRSWSSIYNQPTAQIYHLDIDDRYPYTVYGSQQDNSSIAVPSRTGLGAITWANCFSPGTAESGYVAVKPDDPDIVYVGAIGSSPGGGDALQRYDHRTGQIQLVSVWPENAHDGNSAEVRFQWTYPIHFAPHDPSTLYAAGNKVFRSTDEGHSWQAISPDLTHADPETMGVSGPLTMDSAGAEMYATVFSLMVSRHAPGTLMAGSDDGRVHVTENDGDEWREVTPPELPKFSQVTMLAESPHEPGVVYLTAARHKHGDYAPYVFKTDDLGASWHKIVGGLPADDFCRVVREDPDRRGLLYVGTELGLFVSADDGASWQPMQGNLPVTPVYDLMLKHGDLVVATHGRSFWILDDVSQVHQMADGVPADAPHLFTPRTTVRTPPHLFSEFWGSPGGKNYHVTIGQNATFYLDVEETGHKVKRVLDSGEDLRAGVRVAYVLPEAPAGPVTLTVADAAGSVLDSFHSDIPADEDDRDGLYCTAVAGMNEFWWPMRHADGEKMVDTDFHSRPGGPLAVPGTYTVTIEVGDWSESRSFDLVKDPRVDTSQEDLVEQRDLLLEIRDKLSELVVGVNACRSIAKQLGVWKERLAGTEPDLLADIDAMVDRFAAIEAELVQKELTTPGDTLNYRLKLFEKLGDLVPIVSSADARPTVQSREVFAKLGGQIDEQLGRLAELRSGALADLNGQLGATGQGIVEA